MTEEELKEKMDKDLEEVFNVKSIIDFQFDLMQKAYTKGLETGLKAGRPQWHDLLKDKNDLPKGNNPVLVIIDYLSLGKEYEIRENLKEDNKGVIAWCEIPTFDKE